MRFSVEKTWTQCGQQIVTIQWSRMRQGCLPKMGKASRAEHKKLVKMTVKVKRVHEWEEDKGQMERAEGYCSVKEHGFPGGQLERDKVVEIEIAARIKIGRREEEGWVKRGNSLEVKKMGKITARVFGLWCGLDLRTGLRKGEAAFFFFFFSAN